ncbi:MAG: hydantoinase B/oxoprolinase family protein, partial [Pseudomonadota bacterium]
STLFLWFERSVTTAWGLSDGESGRAPIVHVERPDDEPQQLRKINGLSVPAGTRIRSRTGGGGGYGNPRQRAPQAVVDDVIDGYVSIDTARSVYGVVVNDNRELDQAATAALRASAT